MNGSLDDIAIYNRALSQQEITALYQGANTTSNCLTLPSNLQQGLVGYWPFCGNALDESGNGNHGTVNGATLTTDRFGSNGNSFQFDGLNDWINMPSGNNPSLNVTGSFTLGFWIKTTQGTDAGCIGFGDNLNSSNGGILAALGNGIEGTNGKLTVMVGNQWYAGNGLLNTNSWRFVCIRYNNGELKFIVDDVVDSTFSNVAPPTSFSGLRALGARNDGSFGYFDGQIDDIAIWNRALSQQEITQLYNQGICQTSITVTDTLLIHTSITSYNPVAYQNTLKVWPNPGNQDITLDAGNLSLMQGWKIKISNSLGQEVYPATLISQQQQVLDMSTWGGNGLYFLNLINPQGHITEVKKIVLAP
jgi:hypothetical protein